MVLNLSRIIIDFVVKVLVKTGYHFYDFLFILNTYLYLKKFDLKKFDLRKNDKKLSILPFLFDFNEFSFTKTYIFSINL